MAASTPVSRPVVMALFVLALAPVLAVVLTRTGVHYLPIADQATIDLRVRDVFTANPPLVGAYSRGFNHPGPILFWLLAPLSAAAGGAAWATLVGGALLQGVAIVGVGLTALRRGGVACMVLMLAALALVYAGVPTSGDFIETWNPYVALPFFVLFLLLVWSVGVGDHRLVVGAVVVGSVVVQLHVGYVPLVGAAFLWVAVVGVVGWTRREPAFRYQGGAAWLAAFAWSGVALVVLWLAPVVQQLTGRPGNFTALWDYFRSGAPTAGWSTGAGLFAAEFKFLPNWLGGNDPLGFGTGAAAPASLLWLAVPIAVLAAGYWAARRSGRTADRRLVELAAVTALASIVGMARLTVALTPFLFLWRVAAAVFVVAAGSWAIANALGLPSSRTAAPVCAGMLVLAMIFGFGTETVNVVQHRHQVADMEPVVEHVMAQLHREGLPHGRVLVRAVDDPNLSALDQGLIDALDRAGVAVKVDPEYGFHFGEQRVATRAEVSEVWYDTEQGHFKSLLSADPNARMVASWTPLSQSDERELVGLQRTVAAELDRAGRNDLLDKLDTELVAWVFAANPVPGVDPHQLDRIGQLNAKVARSGTCRCAVFAYPAATAPELPYTHG